MIVLLYFEALWNLSYCTRKYVCLLTMNESALSSSAFENRLRPGLGFHTMQTNRAVEQNVNIKWS